MWREAALTAAATDSIIEVPAEVAQVVEHGTENAGVDSSSLSLGTTVSFLIVFSFIGVSLTTLKAPYPVILLDKITEQHSNSQ